MIYVTGDMHGDLERFSAPALRKLKKGDTLLICGDFGFLWDGSKPELAALKKIGGKRYTVAFVDGAHEYFELLGAYPIVDWNGGRARHLGGKLYHMMRGELYTIEGKTVLAMGGGTCPDEDLRDDSRMRWELPSREEYDRALEAITAVGGHIDYIITHEPPLKIKAFLQLKSGSQSRSEASGLNTFFEEMGKCCTFKRWLFGSMHMDKHIASTHTAVFKKVIGLEG